MYYNEDFLRSKWREFCKRSNQVEKEIDPREFSHYGFKELISHRLPIYEEIAENWGVTVTSEQITNLKSENDFIDIISEAIDRKREEC